MKKVYNDDMYLKMTLYLNLIPSFLILICFFFFLFFFHYFFYMDQLNFHMLDDLVTTFSFSTSIACKMSVNHMLSTVGFDMLLPKLS